MCTDWQVVERVGTKVSFKKQFQVGDTLVKARGVSKRFVESDRTVLVWESESEWVGEPGSDPIAIEERGWSIVRPYPELTEAAGVVPTPSQRAASPLSMLQSFILMTPGGEATSSEPQQTPQPKHVAILSKVVLPSYQAMSRARLQHLENMLMEESLLQHRITAA